MLRPLLIAALMLAAAPLARADQCPAGSLSGLPDLAELTANYPSATDLYRPRLESLERMLLTQLSRPPASELRLQGKRRITVSDRMRLRDELDFQLVLTCDGRFALIDDRHRVFTGVFIRPGEERRKLRLRLDRPSVELLQSSLAEASPAGLNARFFFRGDGDPAIRVKINRRGTRLRMEGRAGLLVVLGADTSTGRVRFQMTGRLP